MTPSPIALATSGVPPTVVAAHEVRLTPKPEKASEHVDGLRGPLGVAATRAALVA